MEIGINLDHPIYRGGTDPNRVEGGLSPTSFKSPDAGFRSPNADWRSPDEEWKSSNAEWDSPNKGWSTPQD